MIRYTTPAIALRVPNNDLTSSKVWVTIRQRHLNRVNRYETEVGYTTLTVDDANTALVDTDTYVTFSLSQDQSAMFDVSSSEQVYVQVNWMDSNGRRQATKIRPLENLENLLQEVLSYE